jgi:ABC transporter substrate binding protein (PQQ-dependent alcohol dehydrogenase system)
MIERADGLFATLLLAIGLLIAVPLAPSRADEATPAAQSVTLGYVELADDPRYANRGSISGIEFTDLGRPYLGSQAALRDAQAIGRVIKVGFSMERATGKSVDDLVQRVSDWIVAKDVHFVLADLQAPALKELAHRLANRPVLLFNVSAPDDSLRGADCSANVLHTYPSEAMLSDALVQYLASKDWTQILVLQGPAPEDTAMVAALQRSARKFKARIVETRPFLLSNDPRNRAQNNIMLMTSGARYDVVYVADSSGEFGRYVPYQTSLPRPVVGSAGLVATAWSWSWDRDAAVQLQHRFEKLSPPRRMNGADWAAWEAVKAITEAVARTRLVGFDPIKEFLLSDKLNLDTVKGNPGNFRTWDHQLRAPVLLATADAVIERAPLPQFLHQTNVLDTLGIDAPESACRF